MNNYWKYILFPGFLDDVTDCTFINMDELDLTEVLNHITKMAIEDFLFPKVSLAYELNEEYDPLDGATYGYYFTDPNIGNAEFKVIWAFMKVYWVQTQITMDVNFRNPFFDATIKGYSPANMLNAMKETLVTLTKEAEKARFNYGRKDAEGKVRWGQINAK